MKMKNIILVASVFAVTTVTQAITVTKSPDLGAFWQSVSPAGTYVYANSFVATETGFVTGLGTWMNTKVEDVTTELVFHVLGSVGGIVANGPSMSSILATSNAVSGMSGALSLYSAGMQSSLSLTSGETYWFALSAIGSTGIGDYQVGAHTQNSEGIVDNGTFWYSNNPIGSSFSGGYTPEMAFEVTIEGSHCEVPDTGSTLAFLGLGLFSVVFLRRRVSCG